MATIRMNNIGGPINDLNKTLLAPEKIIPGIKHVISEGLAKAEKQIQEEIKNHISTKKRLIDVEQKLSEQNKKTMDQQKEIDDYKKNISAQQVEIDKYKTDTLAQQQQTDEHKTNISAQQKEIAEQKVVQDLQKKLVELEKKNSINVFKTITIAVAVVTLTAIINKYIK